MIYVCYICGIVHNTTTDTFKCCQDKKGIPIYDKPSGVKYDDGKPRLDLLSTAWLNGVGKVMGYGAKKYAAHNWRGGIVYSRLVAACLRHITAFNDGQDLDPETGLSHLYHASCCLMFLSEFVEHRPDLDDRYKRQIKVEEDKK